MRKFIDIVSQSVKETQIDNELIPAATVDQDGKRFGMLREMELVQKSDKTILNTTKRAKKTR